MINNILIGQIAQFQEKICLSDQKFAKSVGINPSTWSFLKAGKRNPGHKFLRAVAQKYPELQLPIFEYMAKGE